MDFSVEHFDELGRRISFTVPSAEFESRVSKEIDTQAKRFKAKGFRPGKVPRDVVKRRMGPQIRYTVVDEIARSSIKQALDENGWEPLEVPKVTIESLDEGMDVSFRTEIEIRPQIEFDAIRDLRFRVPKLRVDEYFFKRAYFRIVRRLARWQSVEGPAEPGDIVDVRYRGDGLSASDESSVEDAVVTKSKSENGTESGSGEADEWPLLKLDVGNPTPNNPLARKLDTLVSNMVIDEQRLIELDLSETAPSLASNRAAPEPMKYRVLISGIERPTLPDTITSEECGGMGYPFANDELTLKREVREHLERSLHEHSLDWAAKELLPEIVNIIGIPRPQRYFSKRLEEMDELFLALDEYRQQDARSGAAPQSERTGHNHSDQSDSINHEGKSIEEHENQSRLQQHEEDIWRELTESFIIRAYAQQNSLEVSQDALRARANQRLISRARSGEGSLDENSYQQMLQESANEILRYQVLDGLLERIQVERVECTATQFEESRYDFQRLMEPKKIGESD